MTLLVALGLLLPALALFAPVTLGGRTLVPYDALVTDPVYRAALEEDGVTTAHNDLVGDLVFENDVWKRYLVDTVRSGELPLWNPYLFGGVPFLAAGQHSALYPSTLLFFAMDPARAFGWNALLATWLAALAMYAFGRTLGLGRVAGAFMGLAWSLGLPFVASTVFPMIQGVFVWTPVILAGIEVVVRGAARRGTVDVVPRGLATAQLLVVAVATALAALSGHVEMLYYAGLLAAAYALFRLGSLVRPVGPAGAIRVGIWLAGAGLAGGLVAAVQLVPLAELAGATVPDFVEGRSLAPLFGAGLPEPTTWRQAFLIEAYSGGSRANRGTPVPTTVAGPYGPVGVWESPDPFDLSEEAEPAGPQQDEGDEGAERLRYVALRTGRYTYV